MPPVKARNLELSCPPSKRGIASFMPPNKVWNCVVHAPHQSVELPDLSVKRALLRAG
jgi:hypothetical protein